MCVKSVPLQAKTRPRGFQEVTVPRFHDNGTEWWYDCQPYTPAAFYPQEVLLVLIPVRG